MARNRQARTGTLQIHGAPPYRRTTALQHRVHNTHVSVKAAGFLHEEASAVISSAALHHQIHEYKIPFYIKNPRRATPRNDGAVRRCVAAAGRRRRRQAQTHAPAHDHLKSQVAGRAARQSVIARAQLALRAPVRRA